MVESEEELKSPAIRAKEGSEKAGLNTGFKILRSWHLIATFHGKQK